jgi:hypothetical protein
MHSYLGFPNLKNPALLRHLNNLATVWSHPSHALDPKVHDNSQLCTLTIGKVYTFWAPQNGLHDCLYQILTLGNHTDPRDPLEPVQGRAELRFLGNPCSPVITKQRKLGPVSIT